MNILRHKILNWALTLLFDLLFDIEHLIELIYHSSEISVIVLHLSFDLLQGSFSIGKLILKVHISSVLLHGPIKMVNLKERLLFKLLEVLEHIFLVFVELRESIVVGLYLLKYLENSLFEGIFDSNIRQVLLDFFLLLLL
jgi:hypothetical protein